MAAMRKTSRSLRKSWMSQLRDFAVIRFLAFANAASSRMRCRPFVAMQHMSPKQSFKGRDFPRTKATLSLRPSQSIETQDEATFRATSSGKSAT